MQIVAAVRGVASGTLDSWAEDHEKTTYDDPLLDELKQNLIEGRRLVNEAVEFVKTQSASYLDLSGRKLVDSAITIVIGHLFLGQGAKSERKRSVAKSYIRRNMAILRMNCEQIHSGDASAMEEYALLAGPVPTAG